MKKYLKFTLFKKVFLIIFCGLLCVESIHIYLDYKANLHSYVKEYITDIDIKNQEEVERLIKNHSFQIINPQFKQEWQNIYKDSMDYHAIKDNQWNILYGENRIDNYDRLYMDVSKVSNEKNNDLNDVFIRLEITNINEKDKQIIDQMNNYIKEWSITHSQEPLYVQVVLGEQCDTIDDYFDNVYSDGYRDLYQYKIDYLKIGNIEYKKDESGNKSTYLLHRFESPSITYSIYSSNGKEELRDYFIEKEKAQKIIKDTKKMTEIGAIGESEISYAFIEGELYIRLERIVFKQEKQFCINDVFKVGIPNSYFLESSLISKHDVYILAIIIAFLASFFISYMITKRIKKIDKMTRLIANNEFDLKLKEKPKDELGDLSHSINLMSEQLKNTIVQLNLEIERVKELESLRKDFINQFTHEMKTPLGIINGYSELLNDVETEEERDKYICVMNREIEKVNQLILSMLNLSRLEAGKVELNVKEVDLEDLVTSVIDEYEVLLMKKDVRVNIEVLNEKIDGDHELLKTVIHNFISNAIKHVYEKGKICIVIDQGCYVFNEGERIPEEDLGTIWQTFVTHDQHGSGLGLAICASILDLHGYKYGVMNKENGVEFYFEKK